MARSFSFGQDGLTSVNGASVSREAGEVAVVAGNSIEMAQNPNYKSPEIVSSSPAGYTPSMG